MKRPGRLYALAPAWARFAACGAVIAAQSSRTWACPLQTGVPVITARQKNLVRSRGRKVAVIRTAVPSGTLQGSRFCSRTLLLVLFILVDTGQALVMDWAENRSWKEDRNGRQYARQTALVVESGLSVVTGLTLTLLLGGARVLCSSFWPLFLRFFPIAVFFAVGLSLKMMAVNHFQAGTIKIVGQLRLAFVALASTLLLSRTYTVKQWIAISFVSIFCVLFVQQKGQGRIQQGKSWKWNGLSQLLGWVCMNVIGGTLAEKTYKGSVGPYYVQKVAQDLGHFMTSAIMLLMVVPRFKPDEDIRNRSLRPGGFFDSWDVRTVAVVAFLFVDAWVSNLLLKEFSGVTRGVCKAASVAVVYFVSLMYSKDRKGNPRLTWMAIGVMLSSLFFSMS